MNKTIVLFLLFISHNVWAFNPDFCKDDAPEGIKRTVTDILKWSPYQNGKQRSCEQLVKDPTGVGYVNIAENPFSSEELRNYDLTPLLELPDLWKIYIADSDVLTKENKNIISMLNQLEEFTVYVKINKRGKELKDISFLAPHFKKLKSLSLINLNSFRRTAGPLEDIDVLKKFTNLNSLDLTGMNVTSVLPLMSMGNLLHLTLDGNNNLTNLDGVQHLVNLDSFSFRCVMECDIGTRNNCQPCQKPQFVDFSFLENLIFLRMLTIPNNKISNSSFLCGMHNLQMVDINNNDISDGEILAHCISNLKKLDSLDISHNNLTNFNFNSDLPKLKTLNLSYNNLTEIDLNKFPSIDSVELSFNRLEKLNPPIQLKKYTSFNIRNNQLKSIDLTKIDLTNSQVIDLTSNYLTELKLDENNLADEVEINLGNNQLKKIPELTSFSKVSQINLSNNKISGILDLSALQGVTKVDLSLNDIEGISTQTEMNTLILDLSHNDIKKLNLNFFPKLSVLDASYNQLEDISLSPQSSFRDLNLESNKLKRIEEIGITDYVNWGPLRFPIINLAKNVLDSLPDFNRASIFDLDLSDNPNLTEVDLRDFQRISSLNLKNDNLNVKSLPTNVEQLFITSIDPKVLKTTLLAGLETFQFNFDPIILSQLKNFSNISVLSINDLDSINSLKDLTIKGLFLDKPTFLLNPTELSSLFPNLQFLGLNKTNFANLDFRQFKSLYDLNILNSDLKSLPDLGLNKSSIREMDLTGNEITQINDLKEYLNLKKLNISHNPIKDLKPISSLSLHSLNLNGTLVDNLWPISHMNLSPLSFFNTPVYKNPSNSNCPLSSSGNVDNYCRILIQD